MVIISGIIKLQSQAEVERLKTALIARAERSRADDGNIDYIFAQNIADPTEIRLFETWQSEAQLNAHLQIPDEAFSEVLTSAKIEHARVVAFDADGERVLMER